MIDQVRGRVQKLLASDDSGHGIDHIDRVLNLSLKFAKEQPVNIEIVSLTALLHDVDDYKIFGNRSAKNLTNAKRILDDCGASNETKEQVLAAIQTIGYNKRLQGIKPTTLEGMIVSDADMCDAMGATGLIRTLEYNITHGGQFFDRELFPNLNMTAKEYRAQDQSTAINHLFEKILRLKDLMFTAPGQKEAARRHDFMIDFLYQFFEEENAPEWTEYLDNYLKQNIKM